METLPDRWGMDSKKGSEGVHSVLYDLNPKPAKGKGSWNALKAEVKNPELSEKEQKMSGINYALGYVEQLETATKQDDCVLMRSHEVPEHCIEMLRTCRDKVIRIITERKMVNILRIKKEGHTGERMQIPGQMDILSFLAF